MTGLSPLLALFQSGLADLELRRLGAAGGLMPIGRDDVALRMLLATDRDPDVAARARESLARVARPVVEEVASALGLPVPPAPAGPGGQDVPADDVAADGDGGAVESVRARVAGMSVPDRLRLALRGGRTERAVLAGDPSKAVALAVLSNPGLNEAEVEGLARLAQAHEEVLRGIAGHRGWIRRYGVVVALVRNPRTPIAISLVLLGRLQERDVRLASTDRNIPDVVRTSARRKLVAG